MPDVPGAAGASVTATDVAWADYRRRAKTDGLRAPCGRRACATCWLGG